MKISIVTISYNQSKYIEKAILSVINQKGIDLEYIVVDAGSTDGSRNIIKKYSNQIDKIIFENDEGPADGLNKGFNIATGDIYGYLNADDEYVEQSLVETINYFSKNPNIDIVSSHGYIIDEFNNVLHKCFSHRFNLNRYAEGNCVLVQQSTFIRARVFNKTNGFNVENCISWDGELVVDLALLGAKFDRVHDFWSKFRVYNESISGSGLNLELARTEHSRVCSKILKNSAPTEMQKKIGWFLSRVHDPVLFYYRLVDQIQNGQRRIPS